MLLDIIAYLLILAAAGFAVYRIFFKKKPDCESCSKSGKGCEGCPYRSKFTL